MSYSSPVSKSGIMQVKREEPKTSSAESKGIIPVYTSSRRSTMLDLLGKQTSKPKLRTPYPSHSKKPPAHYKFYYDSSLNGWREKQKDTATSRWNKARGALRVGKFKMDSSHTPRIELDKDLQESIFESATITKPFTRTDTNYNGVWKIPQSARPRTEKNKEFEWEKPKTERRNLVESASKYQAEYLQKVIKEKDKEMKLIVNQLLKSNTENVRLLKELDGFRGKNYDDLYKENILLKEQISRACRKNVLLAGKLRKSENTMFKNRPKTAG